jgi:hypothetical protein
VSIDLTKHSTASERGWGPGWPNCQSDKIVPLTVAGISFPSGIRREIHDLVVMLLEETEALGYKLGFAPGITGCHGFGCRPIKQPGGETLTDTPSNHSWGLAIDINAPANLNTSGPLVTDMPDWLPDLFNDYGFRWGGDYRHYGGHTVDAMHMEFYGTPADARRMTERAERKGLGMALTESQLETLADAKVFLDELRDKLGSLKNPNKPALVKFAGSRVAKSVIKSERAPSKADQEDH